MKQYTCQYCGAPLEKGSIHLYTQSFFLPDGQEVPDWITGKAIAGQGGVMLKSPMGPLDNPTAYICRTCRKLVVPF